MKSFLNFIILNIQEITGVILKEKKPLRWWEKATPDIIFKILMK